MVEFEDVGAAPTGTDTQRGQSQKIKRVRHPLCHGAVPTEGRRAGG